MPPPDGARPSVCVVVPTSNDEAIIDDSLGTLWAYLRGLSDRYDWELVVIDDGSTDDTGRRVKEFASGHGGMRLMSVTDVPSIGSVLRTAFRECERDYIVVIDAALTYAPEHIGLLLDTIVETQARVVIASPYMPGGTTTGGPRWRNAANRFVNWFLGLVASGRLHTLTELVRAYDTRFVRALNLKAMGEDVNTEILYKSQLLRAQIVEVPAHVDWSKPATRRERSVARAFDRTARSMLSAFLFRPFAFFIFPGLVLFFAAVAARLLLGDAEGFFHLAGEGVMVLAIAMVLMGILTLQAKRYHEELFHLNTTALRYLRLSRRAEERSTEPD